MKQSRRIPSMKQRNIEELEKIREIERGEKFFEKRYYKYCNVESELEAAMGNHDLTQALLDSVPIIASDISNNDPLLRYAAIYKMHFIIVRLRDHAATQALVQRNVIPHLQRFLELGQGQRAAQRFFEEEIDQVQLNAAVVLYLLLKEYPEHIQEMINRGVANTVFLLLLDPDQNNRVKIQALKAVACARDLPVQYRDALLVDGVAVRIASLLEPLLQLPMLNDAQGPEPEQTLYYRGVQAMSGLCSKDPAPEFYQVEVLIPIVRTIILTNNPVGMYGEISAGACSTLFHILRRLMKAKVLEIVDVELCQRLIVLMTSTNVEIVKAVHPIAQKLITTDQALFQVFIDGGILPALNQNLNGPVPAYQEQACMTITVTIRFKPARVQILFDGNLVDPLLQLIRDIRREDKIRLLAVNILARAAEYGSIEQIDLMVNLGFIQLLCEYLNNTKTRNYCVSGLENIVVKGAMRRVDNVNIYAQLVGQFGANTLRALQHDEVVGVIARWILAKI